MKITDYCPRAAPFDSCLKGWDLIGVEVGVDAGAHAEALLTYGQIAMLHLVDPWPKEYFRGYCDGRLSRFRGRFEMHQMRSHDAARSFAEAGRDFDFVYIDQEHDEESVARDLRAWFPRVKRGGVLGYRNYVGRGIPLDHAVDVFLAAYELKAEVLPGEIVIFKR